MAHGFAPPQMVRDATVVDLFTHANAKLARYIDPLQSMRPSRVERIMRMQHESNLERIAAYERVATRHYERGSASESTRKFLETGRFAWGTGQFAKAEEMWVLGAVIALGLDEAILIGEDFSWDVVARFLFDRAILMKNRYAGLVGGDEFLVSKKVGAGGIGTVWKVFGRDVSLKVADGASLARHGHVDARFIPSVLNYESTYLFPRFRQEIAGLQMLGEMGIASAEVYAVREDHYLRRFIAGVLGDRIKVELSPVKYQVAKASLDLFYAQAKEKGCILIDPKPANLIWNRGEQKWYCIDY